MMSSSGSSNLEADQDMSMSSSEESEQATVQENDTGVSRKHKRLSRKEKYLAGLSRRAHHPHGDVSKSIEEMPSEAASNLDGVCGVCSETLEVAARDFHQMVRQGTELKKRIKKLPNPVHPERKHYRDGFKLMYLMQWAITSFVKNA